MKKYIAEFIGTFFIVLVGVGSLLGVNFMVSAMGLMLPYGFSSFLAATAFATTTGVMYYVFNRTSGGHFNPAITLAVFIDEGVKKVKDLFGYIIFQILGSLVAIGCIYFITAQKQNVGQVGFGELSPLYMGVLPAVLIEFVLTIMLVMVFLTARDRKTNGTATEGTVAMAIGISTFASYSFGILATGGGLNPAKILASALFSMGTAIQQLPIFFIIPFIGAVIAFLIFKTFVKNDVQKKNQSSMIEVNLDNDVSEIKELEEIKDSDDINELEEIKDSDDINEPEEMKDSDDMNELEEMKDSDDINEPEEIKELDDINELEMYGENNGENHEEEIEKEDSEDIIDRVIKNRGGINDEIQAKLDDEIRAISKEDN